MLCFAPCASARFLLNPLPCDSPRLLFSKETGAVFDSAPRPATGGGGAFAATRWSLVAAARDDNSAAALEALEELCRTYWYPLYCFARRGGRSREDAQDLVQGFFAQLIAKRLIDRADPMRGRLRTYLLTQLKGHISDRRKHDAAERRGGKAETFSINTVEAEQRYALEPADVISPEQLFGRRWALTVLEGVLNDVARDWEHRGRGDWFRALQPHLLAPMEAAQANTIAALLGSSTDNLKVTLHRLREHYGQRLRAWVADTVSDERSVDEELAALRAALA
jgi:DNA-directed RNA polymerase specialized sigma24 family protein